MRLNAILLVIWMISPELVNAEEQFSYNKLIEEFPQYESQLICTTDIERRMELLSLFSLLSVKESESYVDMYRRGEKGHGFEGMSTEEVDNYIRIINFFIVDKEKQLHEIREDCRRNP